MKNLQQFKNKLIELLGGYTETELDFLQTEISKIPVDVFYKYSSFGKKGVVFGRSVYEESARDTTKNKIPCLKRDSVTSLICGQSGNGANYLLNHLLLQSNKIFFVGYYEKEILSNCDFTHFYFDDDIALNSDFINVNSYSKEQSFSEAHYKTLFSTVFKAVDQGYIIVFGEIDGATKEYYKLIAMVNGLLMSSRKKVFSLVKDIRTVLDTIEAFDTIILMNQKVESIDNIEALKSYMYLPNCTLGDYTLFEKNAEKVTIEKWLKNKKDRAV